MQPLSITPIPQIVNNYHCPTTSVYAACALRPLRPLDARNIDRHTIGKLIHAVTARYHGTSNSDASLIALLKVLREKRVCLPITSSSFFGAEGLP